MVRNDDSSNLLGLVVDGERQVIDSRLAHSVRSSDKVGKEPAEGTQSRRRNEEFGSREVGLVFSRLDQKRIGRFVDEEGPEGVDLELLPEGGGVDGLNSLRAAGDTCEGEISSSGRAKQGGVQLTSISHDNIQSVSNLLDFLHGLLVAFFVVGDQLDNVDV